MRSVRSMAHHLEIALGMQGALVMHFPVGLGEAHPGDGLYDRCLDTLPYFINVSRLLELTLVGS